MTIATTRVSKVNHKSNAESWILGTATTLVLLWILSPILVVVLISFSSQNTLEFPPPSWSFRWYEAAFRLLTGPENQSERFGESVSTSFFIAVTTMAISTLVGVPAAYALARFRFKGQLFVEQLVSLPLVFPLIVLAVALLVLVSNLKLNTGFWCIVVGHVIITFPFVVRNCVPSLRGIPPTLEEAAWTLGAGKIRTFFVIVMPLMRSGILAGMLLAFIISFNEFTLSFFLYSMDTFPFPLWLFQRGSTSIDPTIFSLSSIVILFDLGLIWVLDRVVGGKGIAI